MRVRGPGFGPLPLFISPQSPSAGSLRRPPLLPGVSGLPLGLAGLGRTHPLPLLPARFRSARGGAGQARVAVAALQVPPGPLQGPPQQAGLALHRDPLAPLPRQVAGAAEPGGAVTGPDAAGHLWSCNTHLC